MEQPADTYKPLLTAAQARELSGPRFDEMVEAHVAAALEHVRKASKKGWRSVKLYGDLWGQGVYDQTHPLYMASRGAWCRMVGLGYVLTTLRETFSTSQKEHLCTLVEW